MGDGNFVGRDFSGRAVPEPAVLVRSPLNIPLIPPPPDNGRVSTGRASEMSPDVPPNGRREFEGKPTPKSTDPAITNELLEIERLRKTNRAAYTANEPLQARERELLDKAGWDRGFDIPGSAFVP